MVIPNLKIGPFDLVTLLPYVTMLVVIGFILMIVPGLIWIERVAMALMQDRLGPNRVGPRGLFQSIADGIKLFFKEDVQPGQVDRFLYYAAPVLTMIPALAAGAVLPITQLRVATDHGAAPLYMVVGDVNIGILFVLALTSLQVYGIVLAGWSSNNKYSLLGGLRSTAQAISYELAMGFAVMTAIFIAGSLRLPAIVNAQAGYWHGIVPNWNVFQFYGLGLVATIVYLISMIAETNRAPFDLPEAESELIAGFHTEYSSMKFAMFFMGEYASMLVVSSVATVLWFGGWHSPIDPALPVIGPLVGWVPGFAWFLVKLTCFILCYVWLRATLPRLRYDALMGLGWKKLLPIALVTLFAVACVDTFRTPESAGGDSYPAYIGGPTGQLAAAPPRGARIIAPGANASSGSSGTRGGRRRRGGPVGAPTRAGGG